MKKDRRKIFVLIILLILLIFLVILCSYLKKQNEINNMKKRDEEILKEQVESYTSDKTCPRGMATLYSKYDGNRSLNDLYRNLNIFVQYLPTLSKKIHEASRTDELYKNNESEINEILGIEEADFKNLVEYLKKFDLDNKKFSYCEIDSSSYENIDKYLIFNMEFYYENIEEPIILKISFSNSKNSDKIVIYKCK